MPYKLKDLGSFVIPSLVDESIEERALVDLGANINMMPYKIFKRLGLGEPRPTRMTLQLADQSIRYPRGVAENILVKVDQLMFPADLLFLI